MEISQRAAQWVVGRDTGASSATIWSVMMGVEPPYRAHTPLDVDDMGRCVRLLVRIPEWRGRLLEVGKKHRDWIPLIREWTELERLYWAWEADDKSKATWNAFDAFIEPLLHEGMKLAGWIQDSPNAWHRPKQEAI